MLSWLLVLTPQLMLTTMHSITCPGKQSNSMFKHNVELNVLNFVLEVFVERIMISYILMIPILMYSYMFTCIT